MFAANITLSRRSQAEVLKPTVSVKKNGRQTRKPNCEPVLKTRTAAPTATRGRRRMIETLPAGVRSGFPPSGASRGGMPRRAKSERLRPAGGGSVCGVRIGWRRTELLMGSPRGWIFARGGGRAHRCAVQTVGRRKSSRIL